MTDEHGLPDRVDLALRAGRYRRDLGALIATVQADAARHDPQCPHDSWSGIEPYTELNDPAKLWRCDSCGTIRSGP